MDKADVDRVVIVPPSREGDRNDLAIDAATSHPDRFAIMGRFDPDAPGAREAIAGSKNGSWHLRLDRLELANQSLRITICEPPPQIGR